MSSVFKKILLSKPYQILNDIGNFVLDGYAVKTYSQENEDIFLKRIFNNQDNGFYIDIGACHPKKFSNTHLLYKRGWQGINIGPNPESIKIYNRLRKRDINLNFAISDTPGQFKYQIFDEPALNGFVNEINSRLINGHRIIKTIDVQAIDLKTLLIMNMNGRYSIDLMNIDVKGMQVNVLKSNDWNMFRPNVIVVEDIELYLDHPCSSTTYSFMMRNDYRLFSKLLNKSIYFESDFYISNLQYSSFKNLIER